ncbi:phosphonate ABC transporter, permease protein PhnE [Psychromicrobium xiongbiense]|uniref:phosphonate ABC transporter, permease protein PhnE n=1 Tax=Psychromicrobium xiongbiense TaxID=3051184 RepID=UPI0025528141|nr:phosphonate ABC transporter, permease protein PhnE [Psychromicrobium sp. YIM S02556]
MATVPLSDAGSAQHGGQRGRRVMLPRPSLRTAGVVVILTALAVAGVVSCLSLGLSPDRVVNSFSRIGKFLARAVPVDFSEPLVLLQLTLLTLAVVICGTLFAVILSVPVAYCAARNTTPHASLRWIARAMTVLARSTPEIVILIIMATLVSGGPVWPSIVAIGLHSVGMVGKLFADAIEQIDEGPRIAIRAAGGGRLQEFVSGVLPQVLPSWIATALHRNDINLRGSVILAIVGMPGIGYELKASIERLDYRRALAAAIILFVLCVLMEIVATVLRSMILARPAAGRSLGARLSRALHQRGESAAPAGSDHPTARRRLSAPWNGRRVQVALIGWSLVAVLVWSLWYAQINWADVLGFWAAVPQRISTLFPLGFGDTPLPKVVELFWQTIYIALAGTLIAFVFSAPIGSLAARNVAPNSWVHAVFRLVLVVIRGIPELLLAIVLILATGFGPIAGAFALGLGGIGLLGKLFADSFEEVSPGPEIALRAVGASRTQVYASATVPQASQAIVGHVFYMLDSNIRAATVLGVVGAGGVGFIMFEAASRSQYNVVLTIALVIMAIVLVLEGMAMWVRKSM